MKIAIKIIAATVLVVVLAAAAYVGWIYVSWSSQTASISSTRDALQLEVDEASDTLATVREAAAAAEADAETGRADILTAADDKADAQDFQDIYSNLSISLSACAKERAVQIGYVKQAYRYTASSLASYENSVNKFCSKRSKWLGEWIEDEEDERGIDLGGKD